MKKPKLRVIPTKQTKKEKRMAEMLEKWINFEYEKHRDFVEALLRARMLIEKGYGIKTIDQPWNLVLQAYVNKIVGKKEETKNEPKNP